MITEDTIAKFAAAGASAPLITRLRDIAAGFATPTVHDFEDLADLLHPEVRGQRSEEQPHRDGSATDPNAPIPGVVEKEVPGDVKREALAAMQNHLIVPVEDYRAARGRQLEEGVREKTAENFKRFLQHMAALDPDLVRRMSDTLVRCGAPVRYQAWGKLKAKHVALWTDPGCGGDLADATVAYCSGSDRIELIDRIGICPGLMEAGHEFCLREAHGVELRVHTLDSENTTHLPWHMLTSERGMRLIGARRPIIVPRASVPHLRLAGNPNGWIFVEGWRLTLR
jgi:hypothetical protein